jgi:hypothetical protein
LGICFFITISCSPIINESSGKTSSKNRIPVQRFHIIRAFESRRIGR